LNLSVGERMFEGMEWERTSNDQIDEAFDHFSGLSSAALARVCELISIVDRRQSWMADGARSLTDWVAARLRIRHGSAAQLVGVARRLVDLPKLAGRFSTGELTLDQVDAISRIATSENEEALIDKFAGLTNPALDRLIRRRRGISADAAQDVWQRRKLIRQWNLDESELKFHGRLPGDQGRIFDEAIDSRVDEMAPNPESGVFDPLETRSADALTELAATGGGSQGTPPHVTVFTDTDALTTDDGGHAELDNTAPISNNTAQRLACDAVIEPVLRSSGEVIGVGRRSRKVPGWLRRLVHQRDGGQCRYPGCRNARWLQVHHIMAWALGGPTNLDNLIPLCGFHHRWVHEQGWHITGPAGEPVFRRPDWTPHPNPRRPLDQRLCELVRST